MRPYLIPLLKKDTVLPPLDPIATSLEKGLTYLRTWEPSDLSFHFVLRRFGYCFAASASTERLCDAMFGHHDPFLFSEDEAFAHILPNFLIAAQGFGYDMTHDVVRHGPSRVNRAGERTLNYDHYCRLEQTDKPVRRDIAARRVDAFCDELNFGS